MAKLALRRSHMLAAAALAGLLASCANGPQAKPQPPVATPPETGPIAYMPSGNAEMDAWRTDFSARAIAAGHDRDVVKSVLTGISPIELWLGTALQPSRTGIGDQAEFAKPIWDYLRVPLSNSRITNGKARLAEQPALFDALEAAYGVDREALVAIWGMETSYGAIMGDYDAPNVLANMAVEGRRRSFAESELYALMKILEQGDADRDDLLAGWAGAMGHTQFMPSTYVAYAQDFDGDGKKDIWNNEADALASAANYLSSAGYTLNQPWGIEVLVPSGFDFGMADGNERRIETWAAAGVSPMAGGPFETNGVDFAELWLPAGAEGPKFLLFTNFKTYKTYNNADSYALAIGLSGNAMVNNPGPVAAWPTHLHPLTVDEIKTLQAELNAKGYDAGPVDGIPGRRTKGALQDFQEARGLVADGYPTREVLALVMNAGTASVATAPGTN